MSDSTARGGVRKFKEWHNQVHNEEQSRHPYLASAYKIFDPYFASAYKMVGAT